MVSARTSPCWARRSPDCRNRVHLATKCGMTGVDGRRVIDGRPETLKRTCQESLTRLRTDVIDLWYLHRWDKRVPIEDSVGAMADMVAAGHVRAIGLSEVSAATLRRANAVHPVSAVQNEYSLWSRNPELRLLEACHELGRRWSRSPRSGADSSPTRSMTPDGSPLGTYGATCPASSPPHFEANRRLLAAVSRARARGGLPSVAARARMVAAEVPRRRADPGHDLDGAPGGEAAAARRCASTPESWRDSRR